MKQECHLAVAGMKRQMVQTARHLAECSKKMEAARGNERRPAVVIVSLWSTHVTKGDKNADNPQDGLSSVVNTCLREFSLVQFSSVQYTFV